MENAECSNDSDSKASFVLSNLPEVVEKILSFLPTKMLLRSTCVCRLWRESARRILKTQQSMAWVTASELGAGEGHALVRDLARELEMVHVLPQTVLYVADLETFCGQEDTRERKKARRNSSAETAAALERLLPRGCQVVGVVAPGIVATPTASPNVRPLEVEEGEAGFALLFPNMDGVQIRTFCISNRSCSNKSLDKNKLAEAGLINNPDLKAVIVLGYGTWKAGFSRLLQDVLQPLNEKIIIIAGGFVEKLTSFNFQRNCLQDSYGVTGLAFSGAQVQGASVILCQDVMDVKTAEAAMQQLKAAGIPEKNTIGFMFACVGRGQQYYGNKMNVEADAFRKTFPTVPLFGFFGNGEIGCDRIVTGSFSLRECSSRLKDELIHYYTTITVLIHLGSTKEDYH
ncbi:F-box only protein 22 [Protopterus annectens]|uniref:F-box only protein 22 n=1 Tax=Protopterus annectens TaxID=7888 RepID=UPI001CFC2447|nr:F-box only protein 22 [Protopterus annectens]